MKSPSYKLIKILLLLSFFSLSTIALTSSNKDKEDTVQESELMKEDSAIRLLQIKGEFYSNDLDIWVNKQDILIKSDLVTITAPKNKMVFRDSKSIYLDNFEGNIALKNSIIALTGQFVKLTADNSEWVREDAEKIEISINNGGMDINDVELIEFNSLISGSIQIGDDAYFNMTNENLRITDFFGDVKINSSGFINFAGSVRSIKTKFNQFEVEIN